MTYEEFRRQLGKAGLSAKQFADLVKLNRNSITNYAAQGEVPSHWAIVVALMGEMAERQIDFKATLQNIDFTPNKVRGSAAKGKFGGSRQIDFLMEESLQN
ncbi:MAG: hypothetical protein WC091_13060 [Sulfuricellaceae bacterium]|jgi:hypothetical protein